MATASNPSAEQRWRIALGVLLAGAAVARILYLVAQPSVDPTFDRPILDGEVYVGQALAWLRGEGGPTGAFYLAPGYPAILTVLLGISGGALAAVYLVQHAAVVAAAWLAARIARRAAGDLAGLAAAVLVVAYHPLLFFASRPLGEAFAVLGLLSAVAAVRDGTRTREGVLGGALLGLTALVRPNVLLILPLWVVWWWLRRRRRTAGGLLAACLVVVAPVAVHNRLASGAFVPVSANAGLTLYHGNAPGADGVFTPVDGMGGRVADQRDEATRLASTRSGDALDAVEADRWWGREAIRARIADPGGTVRLVLRKAALTTSSRELGLDYAPALDANPWRRAAPLPFAVLIGLLAAYPWIARGPGDRERRTATWLALLGMLATPIVFYVSSRYRLPLAVLASVPAGIVAAEIVRALRAGATRTAAGAIGTAGLVAIVSAVAPWGAAADRDTRATAHANRAAAWMDRDQDERARRDLERARDLDPDSALAWYNLGVWFENRQRPAEAAAAYRHVPLDDPIAVDAAGNLGRLLVRDGRTAEAIELLERGVRSRPGHRACWTNLVVAYLTAGDPASAADAVGRAQQVGTKLDPELVAAVDRAAAVEEPAR